MPLCTENVVLQRGSPITEIWGDEDYVEWVEKFLQNTVFGLLTGAIYSNPRGVNLFSVAQGFPERVAYPPEALADGMRDRGIVWLDQQVDEAKILPTSLQHYKFGLITERSGGVELLSDHQRIKTAKMKLAYSNTGRTLFVRW